MLYGGHRINPKNAKPQACLQGGDYKQYMDYSKYTQGHGSQGGDFKQYMQSYGGGYGKFTQGHGSQAR